MALADFATGMQQGLQQLIKQRLEAEKVARDEAFRQSQMELAVRRDDRAADQFSQSQAFQRELAELNAGLSRQGRDATLANQIADDTPIGAPLDPQAAGALRTGGRGHLIRHDEATLPSKQVSGVSTLPGAAKPQGFIRTAAFEGNPERDVFLGTAAQRQQADTAERLGQQFEETKRHNQAMESRQGATDNEPLIAVIGDDGQPVMLPRSQAAGRRPASTREQGRPVVSGDANRIADFDTSLDDLAALESTVGKTGTLPKLGAMAPNVVTEITGWGVDAKQRQATIDRVKQVIGKALEGGVLRKEDEYKYTKILPTIGDHPDVVRTKLTGLREAITLRRQTLLDSLADAGYDTGRYAERGARKPPPPRGGAKVPMVTPDGRELWVPIGEVSEAEALGAKMR